MGCHGNAAQSVFCGNWIQDENESCIFFKKNKIYPENGNYKMIAYNILNNTFILCLVLKWKLEEINMSLTVLTSSYQILPDKV